MKFSFFAPFLTLFAYLLTVPLAHGAVRPYYQDIKLPTQKMVEYQSFPDLAAAASTTIKSAAAGPTSAAAASLTSFDGQPAVPRNVTITPSGPDYNAVLGCDVTVSGTDYNSNSISETITIPAGRSTAVAGSKAFRSVTSVAWAASCEASPYNVTYYIGQGEKIGLKRCLDQAGHFLFSTLEGAKESTAPTIAADASIVSNNTADFNGTMDGANDFELLFFQNFRCTN